MEFHPKINIHANGLYYNGLYLSKKDIKPARVISSLNRVNHKIFVKL